MRYIGNKTRLLPFILRTLKKGGVGIGSAHDAFAGTASVSRALKRSGWRVHSSDLLMSSYVFQRAYVVAECADPRIVEMAGDLAALPPREGFITEHFSPAAKDEARERSGEKEGKHDKEGSSDGKVAGRMYFTQENAGRIDAAREELERWRKAGTISEDSYYLLLAAIIEGADRVANTAGVYASYMKRWQPNASRPFRITPEPAVKGAQPADAHLMDATEAASLVGEVDLLYIDPPYNSRQYVAYYHIPEILARGWTDSTPTIRGKVGLLAGNEGRSQWSHGRRVQKLLGALLAATGAKYALVSFNSEGHLSPEILLSLLGRASVDGQVAHFTQTYRRYRADSEREGRHYHRDSALEHLYLARLR